MELLSHDPMLGHITTFGGNPVCCAAALATIKIIQTPSVLDEVEKKGQLLESRLVHPRVKKIRRRGLMLAVELENEEMVNRIINLALTKGIIIYWFLSTRNCFRISPPLTITNDEIKMAAEILTNLLDDV